MWVALATCLNGYVIAQDSSRESSKNRGVVLLSVGISADGRPHDVEVVRGISRKADKQVRDAVRRWQFEPAKRDGIPVAVQINLEVNVDCTNPDSDCKVGDDAEAGKGAARTVPSDQIPARAPYKIGDGVQPPRAIRTPSPELDENARSKAKGLSYKGTVSLSLVIDEQGVPQQVRLVRSMSEDIDQKAIAAVKTWRFQPGTKDGKPVPVEINVEMNMSLY